MANKAVFLDRDDTLIKDPGYINNPDQVELIDGAAEALLTLKRLGYKLVVVSNQSGVARGIVNEKVLGQIHERLEELLSHSGIKLDKIYYCPYHPDGAVTKYRKESDWRKPSPGMLFTAAEELDIDLDNSWAVGDSQRDIDAGLRAGCKTILVDDSKHSIKTEPGKAMPDYRAVNMKEVVNIIRQNSKTSKKNQVEKVQINELPSEAPEAERLDTPKEPLYEAAPPVNPEQTGTERLLREILEQIKKNQRAELFGEFSVMRLMAGIIQVVVLFCLLISIWLLMSPANRTDAVLISLVFAVLFQVMALTFFIMHGQK